VAADISVFVVMSGSFFKYLPVRVAVSRPPKDGNAANRSTPSVTFPRGLPLQMPRIFAMTKM
jgi:hypothetical protein